MKSYSDGYVTSIAETAYQCDHKFFGDVNVVGTYTSFEVDPYYFGTQVGGADNVLKTSWGKENYVIVQHNSS